MEYMLHMQFPQCHPPHYFVARYTCTEGSVFLTLFEFQDQTLYKAQYASRTALYSTMKLKYNLK